MLPFTLKETDSHAYFIKKGPGKKWFHSKRIGTTVCIFFKEPFNELEQRLAMRIAHFPSDFSALYLLSTCFLLTVPTPIWPLLNIIKPTGLSYSGFTPKRCHKRLLQFGQFQVVVVAFPRLVAAVEILRKTRTKVYKNSPHYKVITFEKTTKADPPPSMAS